MALTQAEIDRMRSTLATSSVPTQSEEDRIKARLADIRAMPTRTVGEDILGTGEALARGAAAGATFNFADEISGALGAATEFLQSQTPSVSSALGLGTVGQFPQKPLGEAMASRYELEKEASQRELEALRQERPISTAVGEIAGSLLTPTPGVGRVAGLVAKVGKARGATGVGMRVAKSAAEAATGGAISGLGEGEGLERISEATKGAAIGGAFGGALRGLSEKAPQVLHGLAEEMAPRALGVYGGIANRLRNRGYSSAEDIAELGQEAIQRGYIQPGSTKAQIQAKAESVIDTAGKGIDQIYEQARKQGAVWDYVRSAQKANAVLTNLPASSYRQKVIGPASDFIDDILQQGKMTKDADSFPGARKLKTASQKAVNWADFAPEAATLKRKAVNAMTADLMDQVEEQLGKDAASKLRKLNTEYSIASDVKEIATEAATREKQKGSMKMQAGALFGGPAGAAVGVPFGPAGAAIGSTLGGLAAAKALGVAERVGPAYTTAYSEKLASFLAKHGDKLRALERGGTTGRAVANFVLSQRDPEFRRDAEELRKEIEAASTASTAAP